MVVIYPDDWYDLKGKLQPVGSRPPVIVVVGAKNMGKSTLIRFLINQLRDTYPSICRLEADPGQPDYSCPGVLNLSITSRDIRKPQVVSQRFVGFVNPATEPFYYVEVVSRLVNDYRSNHPTIPLIVNMHGWSTSTGVQTWQSVLLSVQPDYVVYLGTDLIEFEIPERNPFATSDSAPISFQWIFANPVVVLPGDEEGELLSKETAGDQRWKKYAAHFRPDLVVKDEYKSCHPKEFFRFPYVRMLRLARSMVSLEFCSYINTPADKAKAVEGLIVGLCNAESDQVICLGMVSGFDEVNIYVVIPPNIPRKYQESIDVIVRGEMNWSPRERVCHKGRYSVTETLPSSSVGEPYFLPNCVTDDAGGGKTASTRTNLRRKRLSNNS
jgi:hypothetical protein